LEEFACLVTAVRRTARGLEERVTIEVVRAGSAAEAQVRAIALARFTFPAAGGWSGFRARQTTPPGQRHEP
jgi:hypothetical protein